MRRAIGCAVMARTFKHLSADERDHLAVLRGEGLGVNEIARRLNRNPSCISRELRRNVPPVHTGYYLPHRAQERYEIRNRQRAERPRLKSSRVRGYVTRQLKQGWSPELITGRLIKLWPKECLCHETIYDWIYKQRRDLIPFLVKAHKKRQRRGYSRKHTKTHIPGRVSIKQRPKGVEQRKTFGHWEADTAVSRQSKAAISVLVERKSRISKIQKLKRKTARNMRSNLNRILSRVPKKMRKSITFDNGTENTEHLDVRKKVGVRTYFCEPFHSWEKGTVENTIGLIRRYLPKKTDFANVSNKTIKAIERRLNNRPRKCLGFSTPAEVYRRGVAFTP